MGAGVDQGVVGMLRLVVTLAMATSSPMRAPAAMSSMQEGSGRARPTLGAVMARLVAGTTLLRLLCQVVVAVVVVVVAVGGTSRCRALLSTGRHLRGPSSAARRSLGNNARIADPATATTTQVLMYS